TTWCRALLGLDAHELPVDAGIAVVAVRATRGCRGDPIEVTVHPVDAIAVLVDPIADRVRRAGVRGRRAVVAVSCLGHVAGGHRAGHQRARWIAEAVVVAVSIEG